MTGFVWVGALAAFGAVSALWLVYGLCCGKPVGRLLIVSNGQKGLIRRLLWLREVGLLSCPMVLIDPELDELDEYWITSRGVEVWKTAPWMEAENIGERIYGAGTGDPTGRHQCGGVSEL